MVNKSKSSKCDLPPLIHIILIVGFIILVIYIGHILHKRAKRRRMQQLIKGDKFLDVPPPTTLPPSLAACSQIATRSLKHIISKVFGQEYNIEYVNESDFIIYVNLLGEATLDDDGKHVLAVNGDKLYTHQKNIENSEQLWRAIKVNGNDIDIYHIVPLKSIADSSSVSVDNPVSTILRADHPSTGLTLQFEHGHLSLQKLGQFENQYWFIQDGQKRFRNDKFHVQTFTEDPGEPNLRQISLAEEHQDQIGNILYLIHNNIKHYNDASDNKGKNVITNDNSFNLVMDLHGLN